MAAAQDGRRPIGGGKLLWPIVTLLVHLRFRHPSPSRPAARLLGLSLVPSPSGLAYRVSSPSGRPAGRPRYLLRIVGMAKRVVLTYDNLSRRLQPGYNYVGQTNDRQPLLISAVGRFRDHLSNS
jgi:hypothetical protein